MTRVYMVRHGRAAAGWNVDPDPALDEVGRSQALAVAARLSSLGPLPVLSSPLLRCQQTAFPLATAWKKEMVVEPLVEKFHHPRDMRWRNVVNGFARRWLEHGRKWPSVPAFTTRNIAMTSRLEYQRFKKTL